MRLAFLHKENEFTRALESRFRRSLPGHEILTWVSGQPAPASDIEVLIAIGQVGPGQLAGQTKLAFIQTASTGYETVDIDAATDAGIWVSYAPSDVTGNATSVAEYAVLLMLAASRRVGAYLQSNRKADPAPPMILPALSGKTACIVGLGDIGERLIERLRPFEMQLVATDEHPENAPKGVTAYPADQLPQAVAAADYVILCLRASKETENLVDASLLAKMKKGAILINIARGSLLDEKALIAAVKEDHIAAAGLDVVCDEPLKASNPLLDVPQIVVTPHIAGFTDIMLDGTARYVTSVVESFAAGRRPASVLNSPASPRVPLKN